MAGNKEGLHNIHRGLQFLKLEFDEWLVVAVIISE